MNELVDMIIEVGKVSEAKRVLEGTKEKETGKQEVQRRKVSGWTTEKRKIN